MDANKTVLFPCPKCGNARGELELACSNCGWNPNPASPVLRTPPKQNSIQGPARQSALCIVAIVNGIMLIGGGGMFLFATVIIWNTDTPLFFLVAPVTQIGMGMTSEFSGYLASRQNPFSKILFSASVFVVILNIAYFVWSFAFYAPTGQ